MKRIYLLGVCLCFILLVTLSIYYSKKAQTENPFKIDVTDDILLYESILISCIRDNFFSSILLC